MRTFVDEHYSGPDSKCLCIMSTGALMRATGSIECENKRLDVSLRQHMRGRADPDAWRTSMRLRTDYGALKSEHALERGVWHPAFERAITAYVRVYAAALKCGVASTALQLGALSYIMIQGRPTARTANWVNQYITDIAVVP